MFETSKFIIAVKYSQIFELFCNHKKQTERGQKQTKTDFLFHIKTSVCNFQNEMWCNVGHGVLNTVSSIIQ